MIISMMKRGEDMTPNEKEMHGCLQYQVELQFHLIVWSNMQ